VKSLLGLLAIFSIMVIASIACKEDQLGEYMQANQLIKPIEVFELQGGVVGFTGTYYTIAQDGTWASGPVLPGKEKKGPPTAKGTLTSEQLAQLSKQLREHDLATLPSYGAPVVNPRIVKIKIGQDTKVLNPKPGETSQADDLAIRNRYKAIVSAVKSLCVNPGTSP
jgi:hypothetical protein